MLNFTTEMQLLARGYHPVSSVVSGEDALEFLSQNSVDLILMDVHLDGRLDGIETARRIRAVSSIPIVFCTANTDSYTLARIQCTPHDGIVSKPYSPSIFLSTIQTALQEDNRMIWRN